MSTYPSGTPATGTTTLPTAGMNQAGESCGVANGRWPIQELMTASENSACAAAATTQTARASPTWIGISAVASSRKAIAMAGKNAIRTGWCHSAITAAGWRQVFSR